MSDDHAALWGAWTKRMPQYDSLGNRLLDAWGQPVEVVATLTGAARPVTPGWIRFCPCGRFEAT